MATTRNTPETELTLLQGVWFPTHFSDDGRLVAVYRPKFPADRDPWLMTILGGTQHVTSNAEYYATGGRLLVFPERGVMKVEYPGLPPDFDSWFAYRLTGDELLLQSGILQERGRCDDVGATRFVRVAPEPTPEMRALIESVMRNWFWHPDRS